MAAELNIGVELLRTMQADDPKMIEAIARGMGRGHNELMDVVQRAARGEKMSKDQVLAAKWLLENLHGYDGRNDPAVAVGIQIQIPDAMSREEFDRLINVTPERDDE